MIKELINMENKTVDIVEGDMEFMIAQAKEAYKEYLHVIEKERNDIDVRDKQHNNTTEGYRF